MTASEGFGSALREWLAPLGPIAARRMFGKTGLFCQGVMFALVADDTLYFRVDDGNRAAFAEAEGEGLSYVKGGRTIPLAFWAAPERLMDAPDELVRWARLALAAAHRVAAKR